MTQPARSFKSLSTLFFTSLAMYIAVFLLWSTVWPHSSFLHQLAFPTQLATPTSGLTQQLRARDAASPRLAVAAADVAAANLLHPPSALRSIATPSPVLAAAAAAAPPPPPSFTRMNDLPASSSFTPPLPSRECSEFDMRHPQQLYTLQYAAVDAADIGVALNATVYQLCRHSQLLRVHFRLYVTGEALAAAQGVQLQQGQWHTSALIRLPDAGQYQLVCRLQATNVSADMERRDWPYKIALKFSDIPGQRWIDADIVGSPTADISIPPSSHARHRPLSHAELQSTPPSALPLPLCWAHAASPQLDGRWVLGPRHAHVQHPYKSTSIFDDYAAVYAPYDCAIDYTAQFLPALHSLRWLHVIGDSNMRALFVRLCEAANGTMHSGDPSLGGWDLPRLCTVPRDVSGDGVMVDNATVITYTNWFFVKKLPLDVNMTFASHCSRYTENTTQIERDGVVYGWPQCQHAHRSVFQLDHPALSYFGWGNHQAEMGASEATRRYLRDVLFSHPYWRRRQALIAYTEDTDAGRLREYWAPQFVFRNNPRVQAVNAVMREAIEENIAAGLWAVEPERVAQRQEWLPVFDAFSVTHAASEVLHGDTIHFWPELEKELVKFVTHFITHAPQLPMAGEQQQQQQKLL